MVGSPVLQEAFVLGHVGPEAALGGPLALLRNGDIIDIDD